MIKYGGPIHRTNVSTNIIANLTFYNRFKLEAKRDKNYPAFFSINIYLHNTNTWKLIKKIVMKVGVEVVVVAVVYSLQHRKLEISEEFSS